MRMSWPLRTWERVLGNERAVTNARGASVELSRRRIERDEVELFLQRHAARPAPGGVRRPA